MNKDKLIVQNEHDYQDYVKLFEIVNSVKDDNKVFSFISTKKNEYKSDSLANFALICALNNKKCLLVDLDFKNDFLHSFFDVDNKSDAKNSQDDLIINIENNIDLFSFSDKNVNHEYVKKTIFELKDKYDFVFIDLPNINDALYVLTYKDVVDEYILCVRKNYTKKSDLKKFMSFLHSFKIDINFTLFIE